MNERSQDDRHFRVFDPTEDTLVVERKLPHWSQPGTLCFITFRTWDSMPKPVLDRWLKERWQWLGRHGVNARSNEWRQQFDRLAVGTQREFHECLSHRWHQALDQGHGSCVLGQPELAEIVAKSLKHFDSERYELTDLIVMPNHVHLLAAFRDAEQVLAQCESWKHYTATRINRRLNRKGRFWQQDGFDHLVRSLEQFEHLRRHIARNSTKANLRPGEFVHYSKQL